MRPLILASLIFVPAIVPASVPAGAPLRRKVLQREVLAMGTRLSLQVEGRHLPAASEAAFAEAARIEAACSTWNPDSEWSRLNAAGAGRLDPEWASLLAMTKAWSDRTGGAFDPVLGRLIEAWGLRRGGRTPDAEAFRAAHSASGVALLEIAPEQVTLRQGAWIEEGGFLKGYALDRMKARLVAGGASRGVLDFGGQLLAWGRAERVSIADPLDRQRPRLSFRLREASLSCSGTSERGRHILDPQSGLPCEAWGSVAVVMPAGLDADCLSTALFVMGPDRGLAWADSHRVAAAFLLNDGALRLSTAFTALHPKELK